MLREYAHLKLSPKVQVALPLEQVGDEMSLFRTQICPIPGVPEAVLGVVHTGGKLLWVIDLADFLAEVLGLMRRSHPLRDELTLVLIRQGLPSEQDPLTPLACVVGSRLPAFTLNPAHFHPIPDPWKALLGPLFSGLTWIEPATPSASNRFPVGLLQVSALFEALSRCRTRTGGEFR
jgi:twitching motility protein PilI